MAAHPPSHESGARPGRSGVRRRHWLHRLEGIGALTGIFWLLNVLTFGLWYYYLDGGGPHQRHVAPYHSDDLIFPQRGLDDPHWEGWRPGIIDYLFFAFNTSTAFSPTDTTVLSWRIKV